MLSKKLILPIMMALVLVLTACTSDNEATNPNLDTEVEDDKVNEENIGDELTEEDADKEEMDNKVSGNILVDEYEVKIRPEQVFDIYMEKYPDTKVREIELDEDDNKYEYKIKGYLGSEEYELKIDSLNGNIIKEDKEIEDDLYGEITRANVEKIEKIVNRVLKEAESDSRLDEWTLKTKDGRVELEIEVDRKNGDDFEHTYDIETGELVEIDD